MSLIELALWLFLGFALFLIIKDIVVYLKNKSRNNNEHHYISILDYTCSPLSIEDGKRWYIDHLKPAFVKAMDADVILDVDLDGVPGYAYGFLNGSFGTLALEHGYNNTTKHINVICNDEPRLVEDIDNLMFEVTNEL